MSKNLRIIFMGTPEFAVASLDALLKSDHQVVAVVTAADKPSGRGQHIHKSAVKIFAEDHAIQVLQPEKLRDVQFIETLQKLQADLFVVVAFRMLPEIVWKMPSLGTINLHASLLPNYRGAAPINHAIINGEKESGLTTFFLQQQIDTGNIILQERIPIGGNETAGELHDRMKMSGANLLKKTVDQIASGEAVGKPQAATPGQEIKEAPKLTREGGRINWGLTTQEVHNHVRGLSPYPAAWTTIQGKNCKVFFGKMIQDTSVSSPGKMETDGKTFLRFACSDGWYEVTDMQLEGKKRMDVVEFLRGWRV